MKSTIKMMLTIGVIYAISAALAVSAMYGLYKLCGGTIAYTIVCCYLLYGFLSVIKDTMVEALDEMVEALDEYDV